MRLPGGDWINYLSIELFVNWEIVHPREALGGVGLMLLQHPHQLLQAPPLRHIAHAWAWLVVAPASTRATGAWHPTILSRSHDTEKIGQKATRKLLFPVLSKSSNWAPPHPPPRSSLWRTGDLLCDEMRTAKWFDTIFEALLSVECFWRSNGGKRKEYHDSQRGFKRLSDGEVFWLPRWPEAGCHGHTRRDDERLARRLLAGLLRSASRWNSSCGKGVSLSLSFLSSFFPSLSKRFPFGRAVGGGSRVWMSSIMCLRTKKEGKKTAPASCWVSKPHRFSFLFPTSGPQLKTINIGRSFLHRTRPPHSSSPGLKTSKSPFHLGSVVVVCVFLAPLDLFSSSLWRSDKVHRGAAFDPRESDFQRNEPGF